MENKAYSTDFQPGQIVLVKSDRSRRGAVLSVIIGTPENRIQVFVDGQVQTFYASQLEVAESSKKCETFSSCEQFHAHLSALQIRNPSLSTLYSLNSARVDFIPYQFRPVLRFIRSDRPRLLIADGVGVGKTIEAGLILRELQARREIRSVLIICPRPLVSERKWQNEMKRFDENFTHLDGPALRYCINEMDLDGVWPEQHQKAIVPYSLLDENLLYGSGKQGQRKMVKGLLDLDPPPRFDLVIVDEAHHIRNPETLSHKAVKLFCDHAEAVVFLTATPIQLGNNDLYVLLNTLRPDLIIDQESFRHMSEPNPLINKAAALLRSQEPDWGAQALKALADAGKTSWGQAILCRNPNYIRGCEELRQGNISPENRIKLISDTEAMHTFATIINRTRRRDIGNFTLRKPETVNVSFTPVQQHLHDELIRIQTEILSNIHPGIHIKFLMTTIRRQAASCIFGLAPFLKDILNRHLGELTWDESDDGEMPDNEAIKSMETQVQRLLLTVQNLEPNDPKLEALRKIIRDKQALPNNKIMLFSSFRHTLKYLMNHLSEDGFRVGLVHGGTPDVDRVFLRSRFEKAREDSECLDILLFSEVGCEGLDYQFCDCMVNYDLPWNPMRVEQRIGRIDRNGQKSESVAIVNLITPGTVDADIYERCLLRIGVFNQALGESEEILGEITREIFNIAENYQLNETERNKKFQQLADNKIRLMQEQESLERKQSELFGLRLPENHMNKEIAEASSFWLSPLALQKLVNLYLQQLCGENHDYIIGEKSLKNLRVSQDGRNSLLRDFQKIPKQKKSIYRDWENWLKGSHPNLPITFESEGAIQHSEAIFMMPVHPLVRQASLYFDLKDKFFTSLSVKSNSIPEGLYEFSIYQWQFRGLKNDLILQPIASLNALTSQLAQMLERSVDGPAVSPSQQNTNAWEALENQHYSLWSNARTKHRKLNEELVEYRRESLSTSHKARMALLEEQLKQSSNDKIIKMRQSQISAAEADYARRIQELDMAIEQADVIASPVAYGVIHVMQGVGNE